MLNKKLAKNVLTIISPKYLLFIMKKVSKGYSFKPTAKMLKMMEILEYESFPGSWSELAEKSGVTRKQIGVWRKNPKFINWLNEGMEKMYKDSIAIVKRVTLEKACKGDYYFARMFLEMTGVYVPKKDMSNELIDGMIFKVQYDENRKLNTTISIPETK
jgi:hypothetical protein